MQKAQDVPCGSLQNLSWPASRCIATSTRSATHSIYSCRARNSVAVKCAQSPKLAMALAALPDLCRFPRPSPGCSFGSVHFRMLREMNAMSTFESRAPVRPVRQSSVAGASSDEPFLVNKAQKHSQEQSLCSEQAERGRGKGNCTTRAHIDFACTAKNVATISPAVHPPWKNSSGISAMVSLLRESVRGADLCLHESHACWCCVRSCLVVFSVHIQHALRLEHCKTHQLHALQGLFSAVQLDS